MNRQHRGRAGEAVAGRHLEAHGYRVEATNVRSRFGEVDIVARRDDVLVFVEVKTRAQTRYGSGAASVGARKQARIAHAAKFYWARHGRPRDCLRFDVIEVAAGPDGLAVDQWYENAFGVAE